MSSLDFSFEGMPTCSFICPICSKIGVRTLTEQRREMCFVCLCDACQTSVIVSVREVPNCAACSGMIRCLSKPKARALVLI